MMTVRPPEGAPPNASETLPPVSYRSHTLLAAVILLLALLIPRLPAVRGISQGFIGSVSGDAGLYVWLFKSHVHQLFSSPWFETTGFYPYGQSLAWSDNFILPGLLGKLGATAGLSEVVSYNLIILAGTFLSGFCTYLLAYRLTTRCIPALCAGISFMNLPFVAGMQGHPQILFTFFIPLGIGQLLTLLTSYSLRSSILFGLVLSAAFATTVYYAIFLAVAGVTIYVALALLRRRLPPLGAHIRLTTGLMLGAAPLVALVPPYLGTAVTFGERNLYETFYFAATALSFLSAPEHNLLYGATSILSHDEAHLFPGVITLAAPIFAALTISRLEGLRSTTWLMLALFGLTAALSVVASTQQGAIIVYLRYLVALLSWGTIAALAVLLLKLGRRIPEDPTTPLPRQAAFGIFLFLAAVSFFVALGPLGNPEYGQLALGVHRLWYSLLPGFDSIRAISRIGILALFAASILVALVLAYYQEAGKLPGWIAALCAALILIEQYHTHIPLESLPQQIGVISRLQREAALDDAVIMLPFTAQVNERGQTASLGEFARRNIQYLLALFPTTLHAVNGYSGQRTKIMREFPKELAGFPDDRSIAAVCSLAGVRFLIYSAQGLAHFDADLFRKQAAKFADQLSYLEADAQGNYLFRLPCTRHITEGFELLVPGNFSAALEGSILFESQGPKSPLSTSATLISGSTEQPLADIAMHTPGSWQQFLLPIPRGVDKVRPLRLKLSAPRGAIVAVRDIRYRRDPAP